LHGKNGKGEGFIEGADKFSKIKDEIEKLHKAK
jgi:hypothetical protein